MMPGRRVLLAAPLLAVASGARATALPPAAMPMSRLDLPWWRARFAAKAAELQHSKPDLLFLGDSITQDFELAGPEPWRDFAPIWQRFTAGRRAINLGFKGDATSHLLWRIQNGQTSVMAPRAAVVLIGANNFGHLHWPAAPTLTGIETIIATLHARLPATRILLLGVLPSIRNPWVDAQTAQINAMLAQRFANQADRLVTYKDLAPIFMRDGRVDRAAFLDIHLTPPDPPLHPGPASAAAMLAAIEPWVAATLGDRNRLTM